MHWRHEMLKRRRRRRDRNKAQGVQDAQRGRKSLRQVALHSLSVVLPVLLPFTYLCSTSIATQAFSVFRCDHFEVDAVLDVIAELFDNLDLCEIAHSVVRSFREGTTERQERPCELKALLAQLTSHGDGEFPIPEADGKSRHSRGRGGRVSSPTSACIRAIAISLSMAPSVCQTTTANVSMAPLGALTAGDRCPHRHQSLGLPTACGSPP